MKTLRIAVVGFALSFALVACGGSGPIDQMIGLMDKACNCDTQECVDGLKGEFEKLEASMKDYKPSASDMEKLGGMMQKQQDCEAKLKAKGINMDK